jgi:hypothetical protein
MKTHHILLLSLAFIFGLSGSVYAQNHSIIVDMKETGATTPKPRSAIPFSPNSGIRPGSRHVSMPSVRIDLENKEVCIRINGQEKKCELEIVNLDETFRYTDRIVTGGTTNVYYLNEMNKSGIYCIIIRLSDTSYFGYYTYDL